LFTEAGVAAGEAGVAAGKSSVAAGKTSGKFVSQHYAVCRLEFARGIATAVFCAKIEPNLAIVP